MPGAKMIQQEGFFRRQYRGKSYVARISIQVQPDPGGLQILVECSGVNRGSQGEIEEATANGYTDWKQGAVAGVRYALEAAGQEQYLVRITRILGLTSCTNPTLVGVAAIQAVWEAIGYIPPAGEWERIERIVLGSGQQADDVVPDFGAGTR